MTDTPRTAHRLNVDSAQTIGCSCGFYDNDYGVMTDHIWNAAIAIEAAAGPRDEGLREALRLAERLADRAHDHPQRLVEVSEAIFRDMLVRPLRAALAKASE